MRFPCSLFLAALLLATAGLQRTAAFRPGYFRSSAGKAPLALPADRAHCRLPHNCRSGREALWQFSRLQASRRAQLPGHPQPLVLASKAPLFAVGSGRADADPTEREPVAQQNQGFFSRLLGWFGRKTTQFDQQEEKHRPAGLAPTGETTQRVVQQPRKALAASPGAQLKPRAAAKASRQNVPGRKSGRPAAPSRLPSNSPRPLARHRQLAQRPQQWGSLSARDHNVTLSQLAAIEKYRKRDHTARFTGAYNDHELEVALDGYEQLRCVLPYDVGNHTALRFDPQTLRDKGRFAVQIADFDLENEKVVLKVPGTGYWLSQMLLQQLFWQTARVGMEVAASVSRVEPASADLKLSEFGNLPVTLPVDAFSNETAGHFDPTVPPYAYDVTLRVESIDPARREAQWSVVSVQKRPRTQAAWQRLLKVAKRHTVPIRLTSVVNDTIEGEVVGYPSFNGTLSLQNVDPDVATKLREAARNQSVVDLFISDKLSTIDDIKLRVPPWLWKSRRVQKPEQQPRPLLTARMMEIVNSSLIVSLESEANKTARVELQHVPSAVADRIIRSFAPGRSLNVTMFRRGEAEALDYVAVQLSDWVDPEEARRLNKETDTIVKLRNATEAHRARVLSRLGDFMLVDLEQHPGVPAWMHVGGTSFAKSLLPNETDTFSHVPVEITGKHPTGLGWYVSAAPIWRLDVHKLNTSMEYDATILQMRNNTLHVRLREHPAFHVRISLVDPIKSISERWQQTMQPGTKLKVRIVRADARSNTLWVVPVGPQYVDYDAPEWRVLNATDPSQPLKARVLEVRDSWRTLQLVDHPNITGACWVPGAGRSAPHGAIIDVVIQQVVPQAGTVYFGLAQPEEARGRRREAARPEWYDAAEIANTSKVLDGRMLLHTTRGILVAVPTGKKGRGMISLDRLPSCDAGYLAAKFSPHARLAVRVLLYNNRTDEVWLVPVLDREVEAELEANLTAVGRLNPDVPLRAEYVCMVRRGMLVRLHDYPGVSAFVQLNHAIPPPPGVPIYVRRQEIDVEQRNLFCKLVDFQKEFSSRIKPMTPYDAVTVQQLSTGLVVELTDLPGFQAYVPLQSLSSEFRKEHTGDKFTPGTHLRVVSESTLQDVGTQRKRPTFAMESMDMRSRYQRGGPLDPAAEYEGDVVNRVSGGVIVQLPQHGEIQGLLPLRLMNDLEKYRFLKHPESLQTVRVQTSEVDASTGRVIFKSLPLEPPPFARPNVTRATATLLSESEKGFVLRVSNDSDVAGVIPLGTLDNATIEALRVQLADAEQPKEVVVTPLSGVEQGYRYVNVSSAEAATAAPSPLAWQGSVTAFDEHGLTVELQQLEHKVGFLLFEQMPKHIARRWRQHYSRGQVVNVTVSAVDDLSGVLVLQLANIPPELEGAEELPEASVPTQFEVSPEALKALDVGEVYRARATVLRPDGLVFHLEDNELVNGFVPFKAMVRGVAEYWKRLFKPGMPLSVVLQNKGVNGELQFSTPRGQAAYEDVVMRAIEHAPNRVYEAMVTETVDGLGVVARLEALGYMAPIPQEYMPADLAHARPSWIFQPGDKVYVKLRCNSDDEVVYELATREEYLRQDAAPAQDPSNANYDHGHKSNSHAASNGDSSDNNNNTNNHNPDLLPDGTMFERWPGYNELVAALAKDSWDDGDVPLEEEPPEIRRFHAPGLTHRDRMELWLRHHLQHGDEVPPPPKPPARRNSHNGGHLVVRTTLEDEDDDGKRIEELAHAHIQQLSATTESGGEAGA